MHFGLLKCHFASNAFQLTVRPRSFSKWTLHARSVLELTHPSTSQHALPRVTAADAAAGQRRTFHDLNGHFRESLLKCFGRSRIFGNVTGARPYTADDSSKKTHVNDSERTRSVTSFYHQSAIDQAARKVIRLSKYINSKGDRV